MSISRRDVLKSGGIAGAGLSVGTLAACAPQASTASDSSRVYSIKDLDLSTPEKRHAITTKIQGSIGTEEKHGFMRMHVYGYTGEGNVFPMVSMNNYFVQRWAPEEDGNYGVQHYEVGYYTEFDTDKPIEKWLNPITKQTAELEPFILGPITRSYTPDGILSPGIAPQPLRVNVVGDRVFVPAQSIESFPNAFTPDEWPELSTGPLIFWDSMYTFSSSIRDVINPEVTSAPAEIHMQNLVSYQPFFGFGPEGGRTMVRGFGTTVSGFDALEPQIIKALEEYTPDIFKTDTWTDVRFDSFDYYNKKVAEREAMKKGK